RNQLNRISDTLYQFTDDDAAGAVLLTTAGAVVVDPMNTETALWLKRELDTRFGQTVSYVIYSNHLDDRIGGTDVFAADGARVVAHENTLAHLPGSETHTPPDIVFSDKLSLMLNSTSLDLHYFGKSVTDTAIIAHFPDEQAVYAGALVAVEALPKLTDETVATAFMPAWFSAINRMNRIDFIYLLTAQRNIGIQHDGIEHGYFLRELYHRVQQSQASGETLETLQNSLSMDNYRRWRNQEQLPILIKGIHQLIAQD
ncbi:MAG: hypothetical protein KTR33_06845, partial [Gammaproteobacteria bacterium]|nr:hypothetical protein [Gammaproteobacteria bacterium]